MKSQVNIDAALRATELRAGFLRYTREAYALLPAMDHPCILDIGCGSGSATMELVCLSDSEVVGIDTDASALSEMRRRLEAGGLGNRVEMVNTSLFDVDFPDESFDVLWEEGVLHLLDHARSLPVPSDVPRPRRYSRSAAVSSLRRPANLGHGSRPHSAYPISYPKRGDIADDW